MKRVRHEQIGATVQHYLKRRQYLVNDLFEHVLSHFNMRQVQPETLPKNSNFSSCLQNIKLKNNTT